MPQQTDPLPKLRQRLKSSTAQLPPMTYVSKDEDFDLITPPQESCRHRSSWLRCPHSPDPLQQTKANGISKAVCRPEPTAAEQSGVAMLLTQDSSSTTEVDWLDTDYVDPPVSCECQPSHMVGTNTSLPSFGSTGTSCRTADNNSISQTPARPTVDAGVRQSATDATPNQLAYLGSSPSSSSSSSVHSSQSHGYSAAGAFPEQQQSGCMQHQAFDDLFDTRQSSFLTTQQAAAEPCFQLAGTIDTDHLRQPQIPGHGLLLSLNTADSLPSTSGGTAASLHQLQFANYVQAGIDSASDSPANSSLFQPPCPEATTQAAAEQSRLDQTDTVNRDASHELAPGVGVVSTSHLEIMGWDLFADTLGTFRLLSDSASEPASQRSLPEPSDFGPVTPGADVNEIKCTPHCLTARTSFVHARHDISISDSQDLRAFEDCLPDADGQVYARHDEQCDSVPCKHDKFAYVLLESPRVGYVQSEASRLAHLDAMQPCGKQKQSSCGCYSLFRQRDSETTPRTSFKEWCTRFCAKRKACLYPCVSLVTHHHAD